ncbi:hypothetical protein LNKW23_40440 [Paralimibaculum aggregatum]|uniref:Uncharacterized protein n=1 Tax=Paralimibaculum aggregatum TaxID=3036245 RepID=A0ABQ6LNT3_9RHOB|nr:hypothetical protein LNKW23_40440 [Limibaculum sp. NKW23]
MAELQGLPRRTLTSRFLPAPAGIRPDRIVWSIQSGRIGSLGPMMRACPFCQVPQRCFGRPPVGARAKAGTIRIPAYPKTRRGVRSTEGNANSYGVRALIRSDRVPRRRQ